MLKKIKEYQNKFKKYQDKEKSKTKTKKKHESKAVRIAKKILIYFCLAFIGIVVILIIATGIQDYYLHAKFQNQVTATTNLNKKTDYKQDVTLLKHRVKNRWVKGHYIKGHPSCNSLAESANRKYRQKHHTKRLLYKKSSDGNYWSYYRSHPIPNGTENAMHATDTINEHILEKHGVSSGPNFE